MQTELTYTWRKSSRSNNNGSCVEVGGNGQSVAVRDTKARDAGTFVVTVDEWRGFLASFTK